MIKKKIKILCTICARGGSSGIKNKNLLKIGNKTLVQLFYMLPKLSDEWVVLTSDN